MQSMKRFYQGLESRLNRLEKRLARLEKKVDWLFWVLLAGMLILFFSPV